MRASSVIHPPPSQATRLVDEAKNILPGALPLLEVGEDERGPGLEDESAEPDVMGVEDALRDDPYLTLPDESTGSTTISITCDHTSRGVFTDLQAKPRARRTRQGPYLRPRAEPDAAELPKPQEPQALPTPASHSAAALVPAQDMDVGFDMAVTTPPQPR